MSCAGVGGSSVNSKPPVSSVLLSPTLFVSLEVSILISEKKHQVWSKVSSPGLEKWLSGKRPCLASTRA